MKKFISVLMTVVIFLSVVNIGIVVNAFSARTTAPASNNSYYYGDNPYSVGQCTWYAWGRAYEILGSKPHVFSGNANKWYGQGYSCGSTPKVGAIMVTQKTSNSGHVAVVEALYSDGTMLISEYNWDVSLGFGTKKISQTATTRGAHTVLGYIYIIDGSTPSVSHTVDNSYGKDFAAVAKVHIDVFNSDHSDPGNYYIDPNDNCTIHEVYTDGCCKVTYPSSASPTGNRTYYAKISDFTILNSDTTKPVISECKVAAMDDSGYTVSVKVSDNMGVTKVMFPTWIEGQTGDDAIWAVGTYDATLGYWVCWIPVSRYNYYYGVYNTHVYAYDAAGNSVAYGLENIKVPGYRVTFNNNYNSINTNLFAPATTSKSLNGITYSVDASTGIITLNGKASADTCFSTQPFAVSSGDVYKITLDYVSGSVSNGALVLEAEPNGGSRVHFDMQSADKSGTWTISSTQASKISILKLWCWNNGGVTFSNYKIKIKLEKVSSSSSSATAFSPNAKQIGKGLTYGTLPTVSRSGYTFDGWYTAASGGTKITSSSTMSNGSNHTLYAHWKANTYTVTFNANGGSVSPTSKTVTYNSTYGSLPTPTRTGYIFNGWYTATSGGTKITSDTKVTITANQPLYAQWTPIVLSSISVKTNPSDVSYCVGETLNTSGLTLTAKYSDGSTKTISSGFTCSPTTLNTVGTQKITVTYSGKTTSFNVTVNAHSQKTTTTNATCETAGKTVVTCTVCGKKLSETAIPAKGHTVVTDKAVAATCETAGKTEGSHCSVCNKIIKAQTTVSAKGHTQKSTTTNATCETAGKTVVTCTVCGKKLSETAIPAKGHTVVTDKAVAATCETAGKTEGSHCSVCSKVIKAQTTVSAKGHTQKTTTTNATCETAGKTVVTCTVCGKKLSETAIPAKGHTVVTDKAVAATCETAGKTEGSHCSVCSKVIKAQTTVPATGHTQKTTTTKATCETAGKTVVTCTVCGKKLSETAIPAKGHTVVTDKAVAATCETAGKTEGSHCSVCSKVLVAQTTVPAKGHTQKTTTTNATCETAGKTVVTCTVCGKKLSETAIPAKGHTVVTDKAVAATCETAGKTEGSHCSVCAKVLVAQTIVPAKGHTQKTTTTNATCETVGKTVVTCTVCGKKLSETAIPAKGHTVVTDKAVAATCETAGITEGSHCSVCNKVIKAQTTVAAKGHTTKTTTTNATCETAGKTVVTCTVCSKKISETAIPAKGHTVVTDKAVAATCETAGKTEGSHCSVCSKVIKAQTIIPAKGHSYNSVVTPPTATEQGYTTYTCSNCGDKYISDYVPAIGSESFNCKGTVVSYSSIDNTVKIEFIADGASKPAYTETVTGTNIEFSLNGVASGNYTIRVSKENHVTREYNVTINSNADIDLKLHLIGDLNGDGKVNTVDVAKANAHAKGVSSLSGYDLACVDISGDGKVNTIDVSKMNAHAKGVTTLW